SAPRASLWRACLGLLHRFLAPPRRALRRVATRATACAHALRRVGAATGCAIPPSPAPARSQAPDELVLEALELIGRDLTPLVAQLGVGQLLLDVRRPVQLALCLLEQPIGNPHRSANGRQ